jgi:hypothetical protein
VLTRKFLNLWDMKLVGPVKQAIAEDMRPLFTIHATDRHGNTVPVQESLFANLGVEIKLKGTQVSFAAIPPFEDTLTDNDKPPRTIATKAAEEEVQ